MLFDPEAGQFGPSETNREIVSVLGVGDTTVKHRAAAIYEALDVTNRESDRGRARTSVAVG